MKYKVYLESLSRTGAVGTMLIIHAKRESEARSSAVRKAFLKYPEYRNWRSTRLDRMPSHK